MEKKVLLAEFPAAGKAQKAVSRILEMGGRDLDIVASYEDARPVGKPVAKGGWMRKTLATAAGVLSGSAPIGVLSEGGKLINPLAGLVGLGLAALATRRAAQAVEPEEDYKVGAATVAIRTPSGKLDPKTLEFLLRIHGAHKVRWT